MGARSSSPWQLKWSDCKGPWEVRAQLRVGPGGTEWRIRNIDGERGAAVEFGVAGVVGMLAGRLILKMRFWVWCVVRERYIVAGVRVYECQLHGHERDQSSPGS